MTDRELMQMALDALLNAQEFVSDAFGMDEPYGEEIQALRARLAQPEPEPVAWMHTTATGDVYFRKKPHDKVFNPQPVYTAPPQREWQGLTDEEMREALLATGGWRETVRAIEAKLKEKNT